jgi:hypothetical protein
MESIAGDIEDAHHKNCTRRATATTLLDQRAFA